jgi:hypothetical protein
MPRIPLPQVGIQVGATPAYEAPGTAPILDFAGKQTAAFGQGMSQFGGGVMAAAKIMQDQIDDAKVTEGFTKWSEAASDVLSGPEGFFKKIGAAAQGESRENALKQIDDAFKLVEGGMQNDVQRGMLREAVRKQMIGVRERVYGHEAEQVRVNSIGQADALRKQAAQNAAVAFVNRPLTAGAVFSSAAAEALATNVLPQEPPAGLGTVLEPQAQEPRTQGMVVPQGKQKAQDWEIQINTAMGEAKRISQLQQWGDDKQDARTRQLLLDTTTDMHSNVVDQLIASGNVGQAIDYVSKLTLSSPTDSVKTSDVQPAVLSRMQGELRRANRSELGTKAASHVLSMVDTAMMPTLSQRYGRAVPNYEVFGGEAYQAGIEGIEKQYSNGFIDAETRSIALNELENMHTRRRQMWADRTRETLEEATTRLSDPNLRIDSPAFPARLREDLVKYGKLDEAKRQEGGPERTTSREAMGDVVALMDSGEMKGMTYSELYNRFWSRLAPRDWDDLKSHFEKTRAAAAAPGAGGGGGGTTRWNVFDNQDRIKLAALNGGIISDLSGPRKGDDEEKLLYAQYVMAVQDEIDQILADPSQGPMTGQRLQQIADNLAMSKAEVPDWVFNDTKPVFALTTEEQERATVEVFGESVRLAAAKKEVVGPLLDSLGKAGVSFSREQLAWFGSRTNSTETAKIVYQMMEKNRQYRAEGKREIQITADEVKKLWMENYELPRIQEAEAISARRREEQRGSGVLAEGAYSDQTILTRSGKEPMGFAELAESGVKMAGDVVAAGARAAGDAADYVKRAFDSFFQDDEYMATTPIDYWGGYGATRERREELLRLQRDAKRRLEEKKKGGSK